MNKVFAVLFCLIFLCSCSKQVVIKSPRAIIPPKENIVYSVPGDFDGDNYPEYIYIAKSNNGVQYIKMIDGSKSFYKELKNRIDNYSSNVKDINNDGKEDFILYDIQDNAQSVDVYSFNGDLYNLFSSEEFEKKFSFTKSKDGYLLTYENYQKEIKSRDILNLKFNFNDIEYDEKSPLFVSEGFIYTSKTNILYTLTVYFTIGLNGKTNIQTIDIVPYSELETD